MFVRPPLTPPAAAQVTFYDPGEGGTFAVLSGDDREVYVPIDQLIVVAPARSVDSKRPPVRLSAGAVGVLYGSIAMDTAVRAHRPPFSCWPDDLPLEILFNIFGWLSLADLFEVIHTCRRFREAVPLLPQLRFCFTQFINELPGGGPDERGVLRLPDGSFVDGTRSDLEARYGRIDPAGFVSSRAHGKLHAMFKAVRAGLVPQCCSVDINNRDGSVFGAIQLPIAPGLEKLVAVNTELVPGALVGGKFKELVLSNCYVSELRPCFFPPVGTPVDVFHRGQFRKGFVVSRGHGDDGDPYIKVRVLLEKNGPDDRFEVEKFDPEEVDPFCDHESSVAHQALKNLPWDQLRTIDDMTRWIREWCTIHDKRMPTLAELQLAGLASMPVKNLGPRLFGPLDRTFGQFGGTLVDLQLCKFSVPAKWLIGAIRLCTSLQRLNLARWTVPIDDDGEDGDDDAALQLPKTLRDLRLKLWRRPMEALKWREAGHPHVETLQLLSVYTFTEPWPRLRQVTTQPENLPAIFLKAPTLDMVHLDCADDMSGEVCTLLFRRPMQYIGICHHGCSAFEIPYTPDDLHRSLPKLYMDGGYGGIGHILANRDIDWLEIASNPDVTAGPLMNAIRTSNGTIHTVVVSECRQFDVAIAAATYKAAGIERLVCHCCKDWQNFSESGSIL